MIEQFKAALQDVARSVGRGNDSLLVHITPEEARYLEKKYGGGTENPVTGLKEYFSGEGGEPGAASDTGGAPSGGFGGRADPGSVRGGAAGRGGGRGGTGRGGRGRGGTDPASGGPAPGFGRERGTGGTSHGDAPSNTRGGFGGQPGVGASHSDFDSRSSPDSGRAISRALSAMLSLGFGVPVSPVSLAETEEDLTGVPAAFRDLAAVVGPSINESLAALGLDPQTPETDVASADPQGPTSFGAGPPSGTPAGGGGEFALESGGPFDFSLRRPEAMEAPHFLGLGSAMTPLQQRSRLATFGTGGEAGTYRSEPAKEYFRNLVLRNLIDEQGQIASGSQVLPVETQYAREGLGLDVTPETSIENFVRALTGQPSTEQIAEFLAAWPSTAPPETRQR